MSNTNVIVVGSPSVMLKYNYLKTCYNSKKVECTKILGVFCPVTMNKLSPTPEEVKCFRKKIELCQQANLNWGFKMD
tara:strand:+ start:467 stop:697 length:231 start_codon:yes stop_codon:yes gene_type:complete